MSLTQTQIIREYEKEIGVNRGDIAGNTLNLEDFVAEENVAFDDYLSIAIPAAGKWKFDDSNHPDFPEIITDLVAGQREYTFGTDEEGNLILDVYKVYVKVGNEYVLINPIDPDSEKVTSSVYNGLNTQGTPFQYDKVGNAVLLDLIPSTTITDGLKVSINREASYFTTSDTTKKPGVPGLHHKWFYMKPALTYARRNTLTSYPRLEGEIMKMEREIKQHFNRRGRDERPALNINRESTR